MSDDPQSAAAIRAALMGANRAENDLASIGVEGVLNAWAAFRHPDCEGARPGQALRPVAETIEGDGALYTAFPDYHRTFHALVVEPPFAAFRWTMTGTQQGEFGGRGAAGQPMSATGMSLMEFEGGRNRRWWVFRSPGRDESVPASSDPEPVTRSASDDPQSAAAIRAALMGANRAENDLVRLGVEGVLAAWDGIISRDCEGATPGQPLRPHAEIREEDRAFYGAFPDYHRTFHDILVESPFAAVRWTMTGTQTGPFGGMPASGQRMRMSGMSLFEFEGGRVRRWWLYTNPPEMQG